MITPDGKEDHILSFGVLEKRGWCMENHHWF
jgi:hypothetical protein